MISDSLHGLFVHIKKQYSVELDLSLKIKERQKDNETSTFKESLS